MIPLVSYDGLQDYMIKESARPNDQDMIDQIPNFILMAQLKLSRDLDIFGTQKILTGIWPQAQNTLTMPNLYVRSISLTLYDPRYSNEAHVLKIRTNEYAQRVVDTNEIFGIPSDYSEYNVNTLFVAPTPINLAPDYLGFGFQLIYHELFAPLSSVNQQNYFTQRLMDVLKSAAMYYLYVFLKDDYYIGYYKNEMMEGINSVKAQDERNKTDRSANSTLN
jgi:hypothetical protein